MLFKHTACLLLLVATVTAGALPRGNDSVQAFQQTPAVIGEIACFSARDAGGVNLWCTEGTAETTRRVTILGPEDQILHRTVAAGGRVYFIVTSGPLLTLWQSDGTIGGTSAVAPLGQVRIASAQAHRGQYFFTSYEDGAGSDAPHQLWRSDGTAAGTQAFAELPRATRLARSAGDFLYLVVGDQATSTLWRTDGSAAGTIPLEVPAGSFFATAGTTLLFESANQLWRSDGSVEGTDAIAPDRPVSAAVLGGTTYVLLLGNGSGNRNYRLIRTDGTYAGSAAIYTGEGVVSDLVANSERLFFFVHAGYNMELWTSSGTYETTHRALQLPHFALGWSVSPVAAGNLLYYTHHHTFWRTDGTAAGTYPLQERWGRYDVGRPVRFGERVLISLDDGVHGVEPWISGGTVETTSLVANIHDEAVFRGRIIDAVTGSAIPKARVEVLWKHGNTHFSTDDEGRFVIEGVLDGTYHLRAHGGTGYSPQLWRGRNDYLALEHAEPVEAVAGSRLDFGFALERSVTVSGRVLDASGKQPGANVQVVVAPWLGGTAYAYAYPRRDGTYVTSGDFRRASRSSSTPRMTAATRWPSTPESSAPADATGTRRPRSSSPEPARRSAASTSW